MLSRVDNTVQHNPWLSLYLIYPHSMLYKNRFKIMLVPNITNISYGRGVGYKIEEVVLPEKIQQISATKIRDKMRKDGKLK